jgi:hypothetical protein
MQTSDENFDRTTSPFSFAIGKQPKNSKVVKSRIFNREYEEKYRGKSNLAMRIMCI